MAGWLIILVAFIYLYTGIDLIIQHHIGLGIAFLMYSGVNVGLYLTAKGF